MRALDHKMPWGRPGENYNTYAEEMKEKKSHAYRLSITKGTCNHTIPETMQLKHLRNNATRKLAKEARFREIERENQLLLDKMSKLMTKAPPSFPTGKSLQTPKPCSSLNTVKQRLDKERIMRENELLLKRIEGGKSAYSRKKWAEDRETNERYLKMMSRKNRFKYMTGNSDPDGIIGGGGPQGHGGPGGGPGGSGKKSQAARRARARNQIGAGPGGPAGMLGMSASTGSLNLRTAKEMERRLHDPTMVANESPYAAGINVQDGFRARDLDAAATAGAAASGVGMADGGDGGMRPSEALAPPDRLPKLIAMPTPQQHQLSPGAAGGGGGGGGGGQDFGYGDTAGEATNLLTGGGKDFPLDNDNPGGGRSPGDYRQQQQQQQQQVPDVGGRSPAAIGSHGGTGGGTVVTTGGGATGGRKPRLRPGAQGGGQASKGRGTDKEILNIGRNINGVFSVISVFARGRRLIFHVHVPSDCEQYVAAVAAAAAAAAVVIVVAAFVRVLYHLFSWCIRDKHGCFSVLHSPVAHHFPTSVLLLLLLFLLLFLLLSPPPPTNNNPGTKSSWTSARRGSFCRTGPTCCGPTSGAWTFAVHWRGCSSSSGRTCGASSCLSTPTRGGEV